MKKPLITPSILSANFLYLDWEIQRLKKAKLKRIHYDVMDYDFVPNLTFGAKILADIKNKYHDFYIDIHFMVKIKASNLNDFFQPFMKSKPDLITMHIEALKPDQVKPFLDLCHKNKIKASLAIKPKTSIKKLIPYLKDLDNVLVMTVEPGFGGQEIIPSAINKIAELNLLRSKGNYKYSIEVDGGVNKKTIGEVIKQGADDIVIGSYLFDSKNLKKAYDALKK